MHVDWLLLEISFYASENIQKPVRISEQVFYAITIISGVFSSLYYLFLSACNRSSSVSLEWHCSEPLWIDWNSTCAHVCQPWIICNDIQSISRALQCAFIVENGQLNQKKLLKSWS